MTGISAEFSAVAAGDYCTLHPHEYEGFVLRLYRPGVIDETAMRLHLKSLEHKITELKREGTSLPLVSFRAVSRPSGTSRWWPHAASWGLLMPRICAPTLRTYLNSHLSTDFRQSVRASLSLCNAVAALHSAAIFHRDLSDTNLMFDESATRCWLVDPDCVSWPGGPLCLPAGVECGSPPYRGQSPGMSDREQDTFAVGVLLGQLLKTAAVDENNREQGLVNELGLADNIQSWCRTLDRYLGSRHT